MTDALKAACQRLEAYAAECVIRAQLGTPGPALDGLVFKRLESDIIMAARVERGPF